MEQQKETACMNEEEKVDLKQLKELLSAYSTKWAENIREAMNQESIVKVRYGGDMPLSVVYSIISGGVTNPVLKDLQTTKMQELLEKYKQAS